MHYALIYSSAACYSTFVPLFFNQRGFSKSMVGSLMAIGSTVAMVMQPIWGIAGDRAKSKNNILRIMLAGSCLTILLYNIPADFVLMTLFVAIFTFFQGSISAMTDAITLEYLETTEWQYGPVRVSGSVGYAFTAVMAGVLARSNMGNIFILYSGITVLTFFLVRKLPPIEGHQSKGNKVHIWELLKQRKLILLICLCLVIYATSGYNLNFFSIYVKQMGADTAFIGICMFVQATCEVPFLIYADKILNKLGIEVTILLSAVVMGVRWLLLHFTRDIFYIPFICAMHGFSIIIIMYCLVIYISQVVPLELRATGQIMFSFMAFVGNSILGSLAGGFLSDIYGIRQMYLYAFIINIAAVIIFSIIFLLENSDCTYKIWHNKGKFKDIK